MDFTCAELLSLSNSFELFGLGFNYRNKLLMSINGRVTGVPGVESISGVWNGVSGYYQITGYEPITINGYNFGLGKLNSINFSESTDVLYKKYTASLEIIETGNLWNLTGTYYSGIFGSGSNISGGPIFGPEDTYNLKYLNNFTEDTTSSTLNSGEFSRERTVSMSVDSLYSGDPKIYFSGIYSRLFKLDPIATVYNAVYPNYYSGDPITYEQVSYNDVTREYRASQTMTYMTGNPWRWNYRHNIIQEINGNITAIEDGDVISSRINGTNKIYYANIGFDTIESGIYARLSGASNFYITGGGNFLTTGTCPPLFDYPVSSNISRNSLVGQLTYSKTYTNDPAQKLGYIYSYSNDISYSENGDLSISENGDLKSLNSVKPSGFNEIYSVYSSLGTTISGRINSLYTGNYSIFHPCSSGRNLFLENKQETYREYDQEISYSYKYTDSLDIINDTNYYSINASYSYKKPTLTVGYYNLFNDAEIAQRQNQSNPGILSNNILVLGTSKTTIDQYLNKAYEKVAIPSGSGTYLSNMSYSLKPSTNEFNLNMDYTYFEYIPTTETIL